MAKGLLIPFPFEVCLLIEILGSTDYPVPLMQLKLRKWCLCFVTSEHNSDFRLFGSAQEGEKCLEG